MISSDEMSFAKTGKIPMREMTKMWAKILEITDKSTNPILFLSVSACIILSFLSFIRYKGNAQSEDKPEIRHRNNAILLSGTALILLIIIALRISENG